MTISIVNALLAVGLFLILVIAYLLKRDKITTKFALIWFVPTGIIVLLALFPDLFAAIASIFGFQTVSNLVVGLLFIVLFLIIIALTVIIAEQNNRITLLIQEISLLKRKVNDEE